MHGVYTQYAVIVISPHFGHQVLTPAFISWTYTVQQSTMLLSPATSFSQGKPYYFDRVFQSNTTQEQFYNAVAQKIVRGKGVQQNTDVVSVADTPTPCEYKPKPQF